MRRLAQNVLFRDADGRSISLLKGTVPSPEQAALVSNPHVWEDEEATAEPDSSDAERERLAWEARAAAEVEAQRQAEEQAAAEAAAAAEVERVAQEEADREAARAAAEADAGGKKPRKQQ